MPVSLKEVIFTALARPDLKKEERDRIQDLIVDSKERVFAIGESLSIIQFLQKGTDLLDINEGNRQLLFDLVSYPKELETLDNLHLVYILARARSNFWKTSYDEEIVIGLYFFCFLIGKPPDFEDTVSNTRKRCRGLSFDEDFMNQIEQQVRATAMVTNELSELKAQLKYTRRHPSTAQFFENSEFSNIMEQLKTFD